MADPDKLPLAAMEIKLLGLEGRVAGKRVQSGDDEESVTLQLNADLRARGIPMMERLGKGDENTPPPSQYGGPVFAVAISPDTRYLAAGSRNGDISLFSLDNRRMVYSQPAHDGIVWSLAVSADSRLLASAGEDGVVKIWSLAEGQLLWQLEQDGVPIKCALFSADGGLLATADVANNVKLWNVQTGRVERVMKSHEAAVNCLVFHPTKPLLISGSVDGTVKFWDLETTEDELYVPGRRTVNKIYRLWDLDSGEEKAAFHVHTLPVTSVAFSQDGTQLAACGEDGYVKLWRAPRQSLPGLKARR
jgi:WD40 repeat protein